MYVSSDMWLASWYNNAMKTIDKNRDKETLSNNFYQPLDQALQGAEHARSCGAYSDEMFLRAGVGRVIQAAKTGREWIQHLLTLGMICVSLATFFAALKSKRRLTLLEEVTQDVAEQANEYILKHGDCLAPFPELNLFEIYASDGHSHGASAHEDELYGKKRAVNHIFSLNLRTHVLSHLTLTQPAKGKKKEHEITALKRLDSKAMRLAANNGIKVIHAYDPAIVDYPQWDKWKQCYGVYIITQEKSNSNLQISKMRSWDQRNTRNTGIISDELVDTSNGYSMRRVGYRDPVSGKTYSFLTTEMTLAPGLIAFLYKLRWDIEKVFDEIKNKFGQKQAWAKTATAKIQQANFMVLAHNLSVMLEKQLEIENGITDEKVRKKQIVQQVADKAKASAANRTYNILVEMVPRATQRSLQFIRWLQLNLILNTSWCKAVKELRPLMLGYLT
jgi:hypothetical protein